MPSGVQRRSGFGAVGLARGFTVAVTVGLAGEGSGGSSDGSMGIGGKGEAEGEEEDVEMHAVLSSSSQRR